MLFNHALLIFFLSIPTLLDVYGQILPIVDDINGGNTTTFQTYIVHVQKPKGIKFQSYGERKKWYVSFLPNVTLHSGEPRMIYTYQHAISGFAAVLTREEANAMEAKDGFLLAHPDQEIEFRTTYSPQFLGLAESGGMWCDSSFGQGQVIGMIDQGVKHTHPSFDDKGMPPRPPAWKGKCFWSKIGGCNNKLITAVGFHLGRLVSPEDTEGHGTHTASTAAGNFVEGANIIQNAKGKASGLAPKAHLAVYKVGHYISDLLKGINEAIGDKVDVLSMSLGYPRPTPFVQDYIAVGSFSAVKKGIVPCQAGGNYGPLPSLVDGAPWILTVGACTMDRRLRAIVKLGDGREFYGESANQPSSFTSNQISLVYPYGILKTEDSKDCTGNSLKSIDIKGKIVLCGSKLDSINLVVGINVKDGGGAAVIFMSHQLQGNRTDADPHALPASHVSFHDGGEILNYLKASSKPTASIIFKGTQFGYRPTPTVWAQSNRGPNLLNGNIIKPDVIAPGVNILAAWLTELGPNPTGTEKTFVALSGTSLAAPHVSGIVALLKNNHPHWSPAAIKSAIMTTAKTQDRDGNPIKDQYDGTNAGAFIMGSGLVDPVAAVEPGLIYDIEPHDYIRYLCGMQLSDLEVSGITGETITCSQIQAIDAEQLNYPSISVYLGPNSMTKTIRRTVTNIGDANSDYSVKFDNPQGVNVDIYPDVLRFSQKNEKQSFSVTLSIQGTPPKTAGEVSEGQFAWDSGKYFVRSPLVVTFT